MSIFKRGLISIRRNPVRSLVLFLLVFVLGCVIAAAVSVYNAVTVTERAVHDRSSTVATVDFDYDRLNREYDYSSQQYKNIENDSKHRISPKEFHEIGALPQVEYYDYWWNTHLDYVYSAKTGDTVPIYGIRGTRLSEPFDFAAGMFKLTEGRPFSDAELSGEQNAVMITEELADNNDLQVGDKLILENVIYAPDHYMEKEHVIASIQFEAEIVGLFEKGEYMPEEDDPDSFTDENLYSLMYGTAGLQQSVYDEFKEMTREYDPERFSHYTDWVNYENYFALTDIKEAEAFKSAAAEYMPDYNRITVATDFLAPMTAPLETMKSVSRTVLIVSTAAVIVILGLVIMLFLRGRRGEMGILLALGEHRGKILGQILAEVLTVAAIAMTLSLFAGNALSSQISEKLVAEQVAQTEYDEQNNTGDNMSSNLTMMRYNRLISDDFVLESYDVSMNARTVLMFCGIGIAAVVLATGVGMIYVLGLNPKKILLGRCSR